MTALVVSGGQRQLAPDHLAMALEHGLTESVAREHLYTDPANGRLVFVWADGDRVVPQWRIPEPERPVDGSLKYVFPPGVELVMNRPRAAAPGMPTLVVEGSFQHLSALSWAPPSYGIVGVAGAWNWVGTDLSWTEGQDIVMIFDADMSTNHQVWAGGDTFKRQALAMGAESVRFIRLPVTGKKGLDDYLAGLPEPKRPDVISRLISTAEEKVKAPPKGRGGQFFDANGLQVDKLSAAVEALGPAGLMSQGSRIALYSGGVYRDGSHVLNARLQQLLGRDFRENHVREVHAYLKGLAWNRNAHVMTRTGTHLLNVSNGMVDIRTGEMADWDPNYMSGVQLPVPYVADAECPIYEAWVSKMAPDQVDDLEEVAATMIDMSQSPQKAIFLYGPSRSGKSTFLRILQAMAGSESTAAVTLHQLQDNRFKAAQLEGKILNSAAELKAGHVEQVDLFKALTGGDPVDVERKGVQGFKLTNEALFAFAMNEVPTIGESSRAYFERVKAFHFPNSFAGAENPLLERVMLERELPGILARWITAWQRRHARGGFLATLGSVQADFEAKSNRVYEFIAEYYDIVVPGSAEARRAVLARDLYERFMLWARQNNRTAMGSKTFYEKVRQIPGVTEIRLGAESRRGFPLVPKNP